MNPVELFVVVALIQVRRLYLALENKKKKNKASLCPVCGHRHWAREGHNWKKK